VRKFFVALIRAYQKIRPPWSKGNCRYYPTCSNYAIEAYETYGTIGGGLLAVWRILRCNPFSKGGVDPVPERFWFFRNRKTSESMKGKK